MAWTPERLQQGVVVKLKELPFLVRLFKIVAPNGDIDWLLTNRSDTGEGEHQRAITAQDVEAQNAVRWQIEQCTENSSNWWAPRSANVARRAHNAIIWRAVIWRGCRLNSTPKVCRSPFILPGAKSGTPSYAPNSEHRPLLLTAAERKS